MKIEKVIKQLESIADHTRSMAASPDADDIWKEDIDALEFALTALRSMQEDREPIDSPPAHVDRSKWKPCEYCNEKRTLYQTTNHTKLLINTFEGAAALVTECNACPPYANCCMKDISANSVFRIKFCPECGRPLTEESWAELERRLRMPEPPEED